MKQDYIVPGYLPAPLKLSFLFVESEQNVSFAEEVMWALELLVLSGKARVTFLPYYQSLWS